MNEMEVMLRQVKRDQKDPVQEIKMSIFKPAKDTPFKKLIITACPDWLEPKCSKCSGNAYPSRYFRGGKATMVQIDEDAPQVFCDKCREALIKSKGDRILMENIEIPPDPDRLVWHSRIEWSVNGERWYGIAQSNIKPYSISNLEKRELMIRTNKLSNALYKGGTLRGKGNYDKQTRTLSINIDSFNF